MNNNKLILIALAVIAVIFFVGCKPSNEEQLLTIDVFFAEKHKEWHDKNGYDFSKPCAMCGPISYNFQLAAIKKESRLAVNAAILAACAASMSHVHK